MAIVDFAFIGIVGLLTTGVSFYVLYLLFQEKGAGHAVLGFFFVPYAYIWGWINAKRLEIRDVMAFWTVIAVVVIAYPIFVVMQEASNFADAVRSGELTIEEVSDSGNVSSEPGLAIGSEDAVHMGSIEVGGRVTGEIDDLFAVHDWTFSGNAGQTVTIRAAARGGDGTDPRINLIGPSGNLLTGDDDAGEEMNALIDSFTLPSSGQYTIQLDVWETGRYEISLN